MREDKCARVIITCFILKINMSDSGHDYLPFFPPFFDWVSMLEQKNSREMGKKTLPFV